MRIPRILASLAFLAITATATAPLFAAEPTTAAATTSLRNTGDAAHLFGYTPKAGMEAQFDAGYRKHLDWHKAHEDPLVWYGWYVTHGPRMGMFIDGSFGAPFSEFDQRVALADDVKDADRNVAPYADAAFRSVWRVRRDLSTGTPLEEWKPSAMVQVHTYKVRLGKAKQFEQIVKRMRTVAEANGAGAKGTFTWYEGIGGVDNEFILMLARDGWGAFDSPGDLEGILSTIEDPTTRRELLSGYAAFVEDVSSEVWRYRSDLSLIP
jgi:hypothetical protein